MAEDWKTIRVPADVYADAKERKEAQGVTWGEYVAPDGEPDECIDRETLRIDRQEQLEEVVYAATGDVATLEDIRDLVNRLDDLESQLPRKIAEELQR